MIEYRTLEEYPNYRFGSDGTIWSKWNTHGKIISYWRRMYGSINSYGYFATSLINKNNISIDIRFHSLILQAFKGSKPTPYHICRHLDGNKINNNIENLCWGTIQENNEDKIRLGEYLKGSKHPNSLITEEQVIKIKRMLLVGMKAVNISKDLNISYYIINDIKYSKTWKHIKI